MIIKKVPGDTRAAKNTYYIVIKYKEGINKDGIDEYGFAVLVKSPHKKVVQTAGTFKTKFKHKLAQQWTKALRREALHLSRLSDDDATDNITLHYIAHANMHECIALYQRKQGDKEVPLSEHGNRVDDAFSNRMKFRAAIKNIYRVRGIDYLRAMQNDLAEIVGEFEQLALKEARAQQAKAKSLAKIYELLEADGLSIDDLSDKNLQRLAKAVRGNGQRKEPERIYTCTTASHGVIRYNGVGPVPGPMVEYMNANNKTLEQLASSV